MSCPSSSLFQFIRSPTQSWKHLENPQILAERLAATIVTLQFLQFILHRVRFWAKHWSVRWGAWAAFYLPVPLAAFAVAAMLRFPCPNWLVAIFFAAGQADSMAAYSLRGDDLQSVRRFSKRALYFAYLVILFQNRDAATAVKQLCWMEMFSLMLGFLVILQDLKIRSRDTIPSSEICKAASDHVRFKEQQRPSFLDDDDDDNDQPRARPSVVTVGSLESYRSAVSGCTTLEDIRMMSNRSSSVRLEDACLSSALFLQLLRLRDTAGHGHHQQQQQVLEPPSSASHAFRDLLPKFLGMDAAFELVEVQLSFMYDYFFSVRGSPSRTSYNLYFAYSFLKIGFLLSVRSLMFEEKQGRVISATLYMLIFLEICQLISYLESNGFLVSYMCDSKEDLGHEIHGTSLSDTIPVALLLFFLEVLFGWKWEFNHFGHYSLIEDFHRGPGLKKSFMASLQQGKSLMTRLFGRSRPQSRGTTSGRTTKIPPLSTSDRLRHFDSLRTWICGKVVNSDRNRFAFDVLPHMWISPSLDDLSWTLKQETTIHTILIWHIATWFCAMADAQDTKLILVERCFPSNYTFATMLSNYCAYLVAFRPELLPEHHALTKSIFEEAVRQAELHFRYYKSAEERYTIMKTLYSRTFCCTDKAFLTPGIQLGQQLMRYSGSERWKVMAEFWAEMTLFVAQSGNADAHIEHLARGGELVTQLWAFLSNGWDRTFIRQRDNNDDGINWLSPSLDEAARLFVGRIVDVLNDDDD